MLNREFDRLDGTLEAIRLERFEKQYGKKYFWHHTKLMQQARKMPALAPPDMKDFDLAAFEMAFKEFRDIVDGYEMYVKEAGKDLDKEGSGKIRENWITDFISTCRTVMEAKNVTRHIELAERTSGIKRDIRGNRGTATPTEQSNSGERIGEIERTRR